MMKRLTPSTRSRTRLTILLAGMAFVCFARNIAAANIADVYIVQVADGVDVYDAAQSMVASTGGRIGYVYTTAIRGFSIHVPAGIARTHILSEDGVIAVEPDLEVELAVQTLPTSVDRIDIDLCTVAKIDGLDERIDVDVAVIDTGIDTNHPDLNVVGGARYLAGGSITEFDDDNGHGTEVAGVLAALDNDIGVVGVAPGARLWAIKCFDQNRAAGSQILAGIDWVAANAGTIEILNMSWSGTHQAPLHRTAIQNCVAAGVVCFAAAGNDARDINGPDGNPGTADDTWPAYFPEVAAVSAMADSDGQAGGTGGNTSFGGYADDSFAGFSNYSALTNVTHPVISPGAGIDLLMPGVDIYSTFLNGAYSFDSGTSLSSPLAAGLAALYIAKHGRATNATEVYAIRQALIDNGIQQASVDGLAVLNDPDGNRERIGQCFFEGPPGVSGCIVTGVTHNAAWLSGSVDATGAAATLCVYWGTVNQGETTNWTRRVCVSNVADGVFSVAISNLLPNMAYYSIYHVTNAHGEAWTPSWRFTTAGDLPFKDSIDARSSGPLDWQYGWRSFPSNAALVQAADTHDGIGKACMLSTGLLQHAFSVPGTGEVVWTDMVLKATWSAPFAAETQLNATNPAAIFYLDCESGHVTVYDGTNRVTLTDKPAVPSNTWTRYSVRCDYTSQEWALWVNGMNMASSLDFYSTAAQRFRRLSWLNGGKGHNSALLDEVCVDTVRPQGIALVDDDGDGMDDDWEVLHFGSTAASAGGANDDWDMDGFLDLYEFKAGTNPTNPASLLTITAFGPQPVSNAVVWWSSASNKHYRLMESTNLFMPWWPLLTNIPATPPLNARTVTVESIPAFFRIELEE
jgi:hypothetical protein